MKYTADCPSCANEFEINGEMHARAGLICPKCRTSFLPDKIHKVRPTPEDLEREAQEDHRRQLPNNRNATDKVCEIASFLDIASGLMILAALFILAFAGYTKLSDGQAAISPIWAAWFLGAAISAFMLAQLVHIRATLEYIRNK